MLAFFFVTESVLESSLLQEIFEDLRVINEKGFEYVELNEEFDISISSIEAGTKILPHAHKREVFNYVFSGLFRAKVGKVDTVYRPGDWLMIPAYIQHEVTAEADTKILELWKK